MLHFQISQKCLTLCLCVIVSMSILNITVRNNIKKKKSRLSFVLSKFIIFMLQHVHCPLGKIICWNLPCNTLTAPVGETRHLKSTKNNVKVSVLEFLYSYENVQNPMMNTVTFKDESLF